jgi:hypothetical protein
MGQRLRNFSVPCASHSKRRDRAGPTPALTGGVANNRTRIRISGRRRGGQTKACGDRGLALVIEDTKKHVPCVQVADGVNSAQGKLDVAGYSDRCQIKLRFSRFVIRCPRF